MHYCKKCGAVLPEHALFCPKCGVESPLSRGDEYDQNEALDQENTALTQSAEQSDSSSSGKSIKLSGVTAWINENFMPLFVILGVVSYVLLQFSTIMALFVYGLGVTLAVLAIICALAFFTVGAIKYFTADVAANGNKHSKSEIICFALGIIGFVYVLFMSISELVAIG